MKRNDNYDTSANIITKVLACKCVVECNFLWIFFNTFFFCYSWGTFFYIIRKLWHIVFLLMSMVRNGGRCLCEEKWSYAMHILEKESFKFLGGQVAALGTTFYRLTAAPFSTVLHTTITLEAVQFLHIFCLPFQITFFYFKCSYLYVWVCEMRAKVTRNPQFSKSQEHKMTVENFYRMHWTQLNESTPFDWVVLGPQRPQLRRHGISYANSKSLMAAMKRKTYKQKKGKKACQTHDEKYREKMLCATCCGNFFMKKFHSNATKRACRSRNFNIFVDNFYH